MQNVHDQINDNIILVLQLFTNPETLVNATSYKFALKRKLLPEIKEK